jgi:hypothetical protein
VQVWASKLSAKILINLKSKRKWIKQQPPQKQVSRGGGAKDDSPANKHI